MASKTTKPLSGFPEYTPAQQIVFNRMIDIIRKNYELHGFAPIETPSVERKDTLVAKGGDEKEIYALERLHGETPEQRQTEMALHFDLTVPLARYVGMHTNDLTFPFRRYQIQKVWRGERPQVGRYREFYQCDIDIIGRENLALENDAELPAVISRVFQEMKIGNFTIWINNRKFIHGYLLSVGVPEEKIAQALHVIDKRDKVGRDKMVKDLIPLIKSEAAADIAQTIGEFFVAQENPTEVLAFYVDQGEEVGEMLYEGAQELLAVLAGIKGRGVPQERIAVDFGIVRGLDYYTGTVYETTLEQYPELGSVCSGGRYENLAGEFSNAKLPGVGISIGLSRFMTHLFAQNAFPTEAQTPTYVLVTSMDDTYTDDYLSMVSLLRAAGMPSEVYSEKGKFEKQMKYAHAKGIPYVIIMGEDEKAENIVLIKDLTDGSQEKVRIDEIISYILKKEN